MKQPPKKRFQICTTILIVAVFVTSCQRSKDLRMPADLDLVNGVRAAFEADHDTQGATRGVEVHAKDGVVTLTGKADTESDKALAERLARNISGVTNVINQIGVVGPGSTTAAAAWDEQKIRDEAKKSGETIGPDSEDARIYNEVRRMLVVHEGTYKGEIFVDVVNRNVTLRGNFIGTSTARNEAIAFAQAISGVNAVKDQLMVTATGTSSP